jgi:peptidoglycan/LPS O-acetylase OafA/YrhL
LAYLINERFQEMTEKSRDSVFKYRPDIDGLRAVAILSVFAFHLSPATVSGGFVGVDVFFVISGYLISAIVFSEIADHRFSVIGFYERRIRRIFPALFGMLIAVSALLSFYLLPVEFIDYAKSALAATTSSSNFYFWQHSGYFDAPTTKPLLHTWSLAVEEQFYILFPIFLVIVRKFFPRWLKSGVLILFLGSLVASVVVLRYDSTAAFYMPYTRAWELLAGTIISLGLFPQLRDSVLRNAVSLLGLGLIMYSALRYNSLTPFPGLAALVPCLGSAFIIGAGESGSSLVSRALSLRPMVFIGLISYSLYLWHWPVIILNNLGLSINFGTLVPHSWSFLQLSQTTSKGLQLVVSFILAILSWRFVERPFRSRPLRITRRPLFALSACIMVVLIVFSAATITAGGFPRRFPDRAVQVASFLTPPGAATLGQLGKCEITEENQLTIFDDDKCLERVSGENTYLLIGDSHAKSLWEGLTTSLHDSNVLLAGVWGCRPAINAEGSPLCQRMMNFIFTKYLGSHSIQGLLLEARWYSKDLNGVGEVAAWTRDRGLTLVIFGPTAEYDAPLPRLLAYSIAWNMPNLAQQHRLAYSPVMDAKMKSLAEDKWHAFYVSPYEATCDAKGCVEYADDKATIPLLSDADHLSEAGSRLVVRKLLNLGKLDCLTVSSATETSSKLPGKARNKQLRR